jgi:hypothetical protein
MSESDKSVVVRPIPEDVKRGKRLGRFVEHDERSRDHRAAKAPKRVGYKDTMHTRRVPAFNQGNTSSCTFQAGAGVVLTSPFRQDLTRAEYRACRNPQYRLDGYKLATTLDEFEGEEPQVEGSSGNGAMKAMRQLELITGWKWAFGYDEMVRALMLGSVAVGVNYYDSMDNPRKSDGRVFITPGAYIRGGHEMQVKGFKVVGRGPLELVFRLPQSWGPDFGDNGYIEMDGRTMDRLLQEQGDVVTVVR